ncbi:MAG: enolase C-terminal domain-like protein [Anaerolineae bacterium]|nr:enolase C-terminal domain-like protein [Anaerolineae bacterium]
MMGSPRITRIEIESFTWDVKGMVHQRAFHYEPDSTLTFTGSGIKITADNGIVGEYAGWRTDARGVAGLADRYLGQNPFDRELFYQKAKSSPAMAVYDIALWDFAGKTTGLPVHALIGAYRTRVPAYASTVDGAVKGPLSTPESFADFAEQCHDMGYRGFKMHPMAWPDVQTHVDAVLAIGKRVGGKMDMMVDPYCLYSTFAEALKVGYACDEAGFYWLEDPYSDGGVTPFSHTRLREMIRTPLLQGEQVTSVAERMNLILQKATDFARADLGRHGITGSLKLAHAAEAVGIDIEPHRSGPAELQFLGAVKNANYYEVVWVHPKLFNTEPPVYNNVNITGLDCIDVDGMVDIPKGPGLGIEFDWDYISRHATGRIVID